MKLTPSDEAKAKERILKKLAEGFSPKRAAVAGRIHRTTLLRWRKEDEAFDRACHDAIEEGTDEIEDVALNQARKGNGVVTMFLLNGRRPEKYKRRVEQSGIVDHEVTFTLKPTGAGLQLRETVDVPGAAGGDIRRLTVQPDRGEHQDR
jgi:hypothetical protein